ncbi:DUF364 domain-containing protein [Dethiosulfatarculus sandiegensis]|uniref:Heavy-metal chelation domain-containing protein n=1 Tax=Dethiosulfatarculus sandiegensis TaxID=1429043 RepID=A0A0D2GFW1_9BACT|nr:DUF364 domain-containing protein [Dethiosulfatarculus sandiegensis]KIX13817.1 hypothetical protein X474_10920 [Dethiosulfatarculus sandiegensis]
MSIQTDLKNALMPLAKGVMVTEVAIGLGYTAVALDNQGAGVAYTFRDLATGGCNVFHGTRPLAGANALELLSYLESDDAVELAVGMATANALTPFDHDKVLQGDVLEHLGVKPGDKVGMVGNFAPVIPGLKKAGAEVLVFERLQKPVVGLLPEEDAPRILPQCDLALISSTTLLNRTIEPLLEAAATCRQVVLLGATTPLMPKVFAKTPVTMLSGVRVADTAGVMQVVKEAGGMRQFMGMVEKVGLKADA